MTEHPIERFDPLLRNLLSWGLVERDADGSWIVTQAVSERLGTLAHLTQRPETSAVVYFGHFCAECHASGPTRRLDGRYICDACRQAIAEGPAPEPEIVENTQRRFGSRHKSRRLAS